MHVIRHIHTAASRVRILPDGGLKRAAAASAADELLKSPPPHFTYLIQRTAAAATTLCDSFSPSPPLPCADGRRSCARIYII